MENLCVIWVMFFAMTSISAYEMMHPYGPAMCTALETRYGRVTKYHPDNLTCVVIDAKTTSANENCVEVIQNRNGNAVCIQGIHSTYESKRDSVAEPRSPRLFVLAVGEFYRLDILSGTQKDIIPAKHAPSFMSCSNDEHKIYFYAGEDTLYCLDLHSRKIEIILELHEKDEIMGLTVDDTTKDVYTLLKFSIVVKLKIAGYSVRRVLCDRPRTNNKKITISPKRGLLFISTSLGIYSYEYTTEIKKEVVRTKKIKNLAYDDDSDTLYFSTKKYLHKFSYKSFEEKRVTRSKHAPRHIAVYKDMVFITGVRVVSAINITSKAEIWRKERKSPLDDMCILRY